MSKLSFLEHTWAQVSLALLLSAVLVTAARPWIVDALEPPPPEPEEAMHVTSVRPRGLLPVDEALYMLKPAELGVPPWAPGQFADYELATRSERPAEGEDSVRREVRVEVVREASSDDAYPARFGMPFPDLYWLRVRNLRMFRDIPQDTYRLANPADLAVTEATPALTYTDKYIPFLFHRGFLDEEVVRYERPIGRETIAVPAGTFDCDVREFYLESTDPEVEDERVATVWLSPDAGPLGLVKVEVAYESLTLVDAGASGDAEYHPTMAPLIEGVSTFTGFCHACHGESHHDVVFPPH